MDDGRNNNPWTAHSEAAWRLPSLWRPVSIYQAEADSDQDGSLGEEYSHISVNTAPIQPGASDRLGAISPASGLTSNFYAWRDRDHKETPGITYCTVSHHRDQAARRIEDNSRLNELAESFELKNHRAFEKASEADEDRVWNYEYDGTQGLVSRIPSQNQRQSLTQRTSATRSLIEKFSFDKLAAKQPPSAQSRRLRQRGSRVISALPTLPDNLRSESATPEGVSDETEKGRAPSFIFPSPLPVDEPERLLR